MATPSNPWRHTVRGLAVAAGLLAGWPAPPAAAAQPAPADMVRLPAGSYVPFLVRKANEPAETPVAAFWLDRTPVTNARFRDFLRHHPEWRRSRVPAIFAEGHYLDGWSGDLAWGRDQSGDQPVAGVSWFAAQAYCTAQGKSLPTTDQWEYALADAGRHQTELRNRILDWYAQPNGARLPPVRQAAANGYGVAGLTGLVWEWTLDFASLSGPELRDAGKNSGLFCSGAALAARDATDYAAFMRYSFRASLKAAFTTANLGFRCAKEAKP